MGSGRILIGKLTDNYEQRLNKLKRLYEDSFQKTGWKEYKEIDGDVPQLQQHAPEQELFSVKPHTGEKKSVPHVDQEDQDR